MHAAPLEPFGLVKRRPSFDNQSISLVLQATLAVYFEQLARLGSWLRPRNVFLYLFGCKHTTGMLTGPRIQRCVEMNHPKENSEVSNLNSSTFRVMIRWRLPMPTAQRQGQ